MKEAEIQESLCGHEARNAELLRNLRSKGIDLGERRPTEHHFCAFTRKNADLLADELRKQGYFGAIVSRSDDGSRRWGVEAAFDRTLEEAASRDISEQLVRLAARFGAEYDGWGTSI